MHFLVDTGCTTNLLGKHVYDRLPPSIRNTLTQCDFQGVMADGTQLPFFGMLRAVIRLRDMRTEATFVVSHISEDAILGMPFLTTHHCALDFERPL